MKKDLKIDLVYLWVDGNDAKLQEEKEEWQARLNISASDSTNHCRFIDNQELKYSLRSVEMNAPWINKIFIVTNGQIPSWLDTSHPKIKIVTHKEIMPADALPTFNSEAIETCLANIPELSEYFLYANDDMFINRPVNPNFFFDEKGFPIIRLIPQNWSKEMIESKLYCQNIIYSANLIKSSYAQDYKYEPAHNIDAYRKSFLINCKNEFQKEFSKTTYCKFRTADSVQRIIYHLWTLANNLGTLRENNSKTPGTLYLKLTPPDYMHKVLKRKKPYLLCINDEENVNPDNRKKLKNFLAELYPQRQTWEKAYNFQIEPIFTSEQSYTIVFAPDNNYCKYFGVALQSLIENSKNYENYDIIVFDSDISERNKKTLQKMLPPNFSLRFFDINSYIYEELGELKLETREYWSISMYYRIFIPLVMQKYNKVLYCDADISFNKPISEMFKINCEDKAILAVLDTVTPVLTRYTNRMQHIVEELALPHPNEYFNSGILMFNIPKININNYIKNFKNALETKNLLFPDQDILNILFNGKTKLISCQYNYQYGVQIFNKNYTNTIFGAYKKDFLEATENPTIIHYTSSRKPWHSPKEELADVFWYYARKCPFYEEILYTNFKIGGVSVETIKNLNLKSKIYFTYYKSKILSYLTIGKRRKHYQEKRDHYKKRVRDIRKFSHL